MSRSESVGARSEPKVAPTGSAPDVLFSRSAGRSEPVGAGFVHTEPVEPLSRGTF